MLGKPPKRSRPKRATGERTMRITIEDIEELREELCEIDPALAHDLGVYDGFEVPDDQEEA